MDAFGITLTAFDMWLLAAAGGLIVWFLNTVGAPAVKRHRDAAAAFQLAFANVVLNLRENPNCPLAQIAQGAHLQHLAAITKFRPFIHIWHRKNFERSVDQYKNAHNAATCQGSLLALAASESTAFAQENRKLYSAAINRLLSYA